MLLLLLGVEISFSMAIFEFAENDMQGFVEYVTNRPSPQSFDFILNGGQAHNYFDAINIRSLSFSIVP